MKVLLADNDAYIRENLVKLLQLHCPQLEEVRQAHSVKSAIEAIETNMPDLLITDVEFDDGTGFDLIKKIGTVNFQLIFVTAYNKYAVDAFKFSAIDFLLKPIDAMELKGSISRAEKNLKSLFVEQQLQILHDTINKLSSNDKKIALRDTDSIYFVKIQDIIRCEADGAYTKFILSSAKEILVSTSLKQYEELLKPYFFARVHHSHLVNSKYIVRYDKRNGGYLVMQNNHLVPVSQRKRDELESIITSL